MKWKIKAKIIADSVSYTNSKRITTFELEYWRAIHCELLTHRLFSRNSASSRAIPIERVMEMVEEDPAGPCEWGLNKPGMQSEGVHSSPSTCLWVWKRGAERALQTAKELSALGLHKQIVNRVLEPYQRMKVLVTATEFDNWWWLRMDKAAMPEIRILAEKMWAAYNSSQPIVLKSGEWHLPYYKNGYWTLGVQDRTKGSDRFVEEPSLEDAKKISASCCAQISYRRNDDSLEKAEKLYSQFTKAGEKVHASPFEHQATPIPYESKLWGKRTLKAQGITHISTDSNSSLWSGNFSGWIQARQLMPNHVCWDFEDFERNNNNK